MRWLLDFWIEVQAWILETIVNPALFKLGLMTFLDDAPALVEIVMLGVVQIAVIACVFMPLERLAPAERWPDHKLARVDVVYTLLNKLGVMPLLVFLVLYDLNDLLLDAVREHGLVMPTIELHVPWLRDKPLLLFAIYFLVYDFAGYWLHRMQHGFRWWWALHSLHHSQRQMTCWSDDRNHVLDDLLTSLYFAFVALAIGVAPGQFVMILLLGRLIESFSHINLRFGFGRYLDKVVVDPWFHRTHHAMASPAEPHIHDRNFGTVLPVWDLLFRTAVYDYKPRPTGVDDSADADNGKGWIGQQVGGFARLGRALIAMVRPRAVRAPAE